MRWIGFFIAIGGVIGIAGAFLAVTNFRLRRWAADLERRRQEFESGVETSAKRVTEMSGMAGELMAGVERQTSAITQTSASMHQLTETVNRNAEAASDAHTWSQASTSAVNAGRDSVSTMNQSMSRLGETNQRLISSVEDSVRNLEDLVKIVSRISDKTKAIDEIVFQTKILSFNASVEAARAGENGKGFAVVAQEVGKLAQMSGSAAKEIGVIVNESVGKAKTFAESTRVAAGSLLEEARTSTDEGQRRGRECETALETILENVKKVDIAIDGVARSSKEQAAGVSEIGKAIQELENVTGRTREILSRMA